MKETLCDKEEYCSEARKLKRKLLKALRLQGYFIRDGELIIPHSYTKDNIRALHQLAVTNSIKKAEPALKRLEPELITHIANGSDVIPEAISPLIVPVESDSREAQLFRYVSLHWSLPVSSGYGRRMRFLVIDQANNKLIGIIGLGDPVFALGARDRTIGWTLAQKKERLYHIMDAFVLGAIPPYSQLLCGKLVALLTLCDQLRQFFARKYGGSVSLISKVKRDPVLALITTTSAFGRSSMYNRIKINGKQYWQPVGFTSGTGDFQFSNGVYDSMASFVKRYCMPSARHEEWGGSGFRNRREVIKKTLGALDLSMDLTAHKVCREVYIAPLGGNVFEYLRGEQAHFQALNLKSEDIFMEFKERWLLPRSRRDSTYRLFDRNSYKLW